MSGLNKAEFSELLLEPTFVDYFNVFSSLPIFSQRYIYRYADKDFELDPPIQRTQYIFDRKRMIDWILKERMPYFLNSDLYVEYKICTQLLETQIVGTNYITGLIGKVDQKSEDYTLLLNLIGTVVGMNKFRTFLKGSPGERIFEFIWDIEKFKQNKHELFNSEQESIRFLQMKYFKNSHQIGEQNRKYWKLFSDKRNFNEQQFYGFLQVNREDIENWEYNMNNINELTRLMFSILQNYWLQKYILHEQLKRMRCKDQKGDMASNTLMSTHQKVRLANQIQYIEENLALLGENWNSSDSPTDAKSKVVNKGGLILEADFEKVFRISDTEVELDEGCKESRLIEPENVIINEKSIHSENVDSSINVTPKTFNLDMQTEPITSITDLKNNCVKSEIIRVLSKLNFDVFSNQSFLKRANSLPVTSTKEQEHDILKKANDIHDSFNQLRKHQTATQNEILKHASESVLFTEKKLVISNKLPPIEKGVLKKMCKPKSNSVETAHTFSRIQNLNHVGCIFSDYMAANPFEKFLIRYGDITSANHILLIKVCQKYLADEDGEFELNLIRVRTFQILIKKFILPSGKFYIPLPSLLFQALFMADNTKKCEEVVRNIQNYAIQTLVELLTLFMESDKELFQENVLVRRPAHNTQRESFNMDSCLSQATTVCSFPDLCSTQNTSTFNSKSVSPCIKEKYNIPVDTEEQISWKAFQLALDLSKLREEGLPFTLLQPEQLEFSSYYGSLSLKRQAIVQRRDIIEEDKRRRERAKLRATAQKELRRRALIERQNQESTDSDLPIYMRPIWKGNQRIVRPHKPRNFNDILSNSTNLEFFRRFLTHHDCDTPLVFWAAVESMRQEKDLRIKLQKCNQICRRFFGQNSLKGIEALECQADILKEIPKMERVTPAILISAQACVLASIEENWFRNYQLTFPETKATVLKETVALISEGGKRKWGKERTRCLWVSFVRTVIRFRNAFLDKSSVSMFEKFLKYEMERETDKQTRGSGVSGQSIKKVVRGKLIDVSKLISDLHFLAETDRFRTMCDDVQEHLRAGIFHSEDEQHLVRKSKTIIEVFIDSDMPPKIQINITQELTDQIIESFNLNHITRSLFHDATMVIFPVMAYYWKRFQKNRTSDLLHRLEQRGNASRKAFDYDLPTFFNIDLGKCSKIEGIQSDDHYRLNFTLQYGLKLVVPYNRMRRRHTTAKHLDGDASRNSDSVKHETKETLEGYLHGFKASNDNAHSKALIKSNEDGERTQQKLDLKASNRLLQNHISKQNMHINQTISHHIVS